MIPPAEASPRVQAAISAAEKARLAFVAEQQRVARLRSYLTMSKDPEFARMIMEQLATHPDGSVVRREFERYWGPRTAATVASFLDADLFALITMYGETRLRVSHEINNPQIYEKPALLRRETDSPFSILLDRLAYHPDSGFLIDAEKPVETSCIDWGIRGLVEPRGDGRFDVTVPHATDFRRISRHELAAKGVFTVRALVFQAPRFRIIRPGVSRVELTAPGRAIARPAARALA